MNEKEKIPWHSLSDIFEYGTEKNGFKPIIEEIIDRIYDNRRRRGAEVEQEMLELFDIYWKDKAERILIREKEKACKMKEFTGKEEWYSERDEMSKKKREDDSLSEKIDHRLFHLVEEQKKTNELLRILLKFLDQQNWDCKNPFVNMKKEATEGQ